ncbi:GAF and ANTAR domain-containing protein [Streptomyces musisoli]|uniref:GAF and ANTAR domain-containing protein n=1 Tax=Streptomyces musisoli TaxID=2802280 RepID=UPI001F2DB134|nr:GAF and ANTAR domain-containing protein [Streptomyces musisoli]
MPPEGSGSSAGGGLPPDAEVRLRVSETLAAAARGADDPQAVPSALCAACVRLLPISGASVSISGGTGIRMTWCASDRVSARLAELQYTVGDGPCQSALDEGAPIIAADLSRGPDARRWPIFAHEAVGLGVRAVFSLPLGVSGAAVGTLDLYSHRSGGLAEPDLRTALWVRDAVTFALMNLQAGDHGGTGEDTGEDTENEVASWVAASEADHTEVYQAVGMVMVQLDVDPEQSLDRLRARAYAEGRTVSQVARDVLARRLSFRPDAYDEPVAYGEPEARDEAVAYDEPEARDEAVAYGDPGRPQGGDPGRPYGGDPGRPYGGDTGHEYGGDPGRPYDGDPGRPQGGDTGRYGEHGPERPVGEDGERDSGDEGRDGER